MKMLSSSVRKKTPLTCGSDACMIYEFSVNRHVAVNVARHVQGCTRRMWRRGWRIWQTRCWRYRRCATTPASCASRPTLPGAPHPICLGNVLDNHLLVRFADAVLEVQALRMSSGLV